MKQIRLTKGLYALVNDRDYEWLMQWKWYAEIAGRGTKFYAARREGKLKIKMHRAIVERHGVVVPPGFVVDHVNHNSLDNRLYVGGIGLESKLQLEVITQAENMRRSPNFRKKGEKYVHANSSSNGRNKKRTAAKRKKKNRPTCRADIFYRRRTFGCAVDGSAT